MGCYKPEFDYQSRFLGVRAGFSLQSFCSGEEQKGFSLQSLTQTLSKYQNIAFSDHYRSFFNRT